MTNLFHIQGDELLRIQPSRMSSEDQLENWICQNPRQFGLDVMIIGRQIITAHEGRLDLLGIDEDGDLVVIELKRDRTPRDVVAQALDYASWVRKLTPKDVADIALQYLKERIEIAFEKYFGTSLPDRINGSHSIVIVASEFDASSRRIVEYLSKEYGININTAFFRIFNHNATTFLATEWLVDQENVAENAKARKSYAWSGWYYVNVGHEDNVRSWEDMRRFGFLAAGYGIRYSGALRKLRIGDPVFAYQKQKGYVGYGTINSEAVPASEFPVNGQHLSDLELQQRNVFHDAGQELQDWMVGVDWKKTVSLDEGLTFPGAFANQNVVCRLIHPATIDFLKQHFVESRGPANG
jgi:hypothetical protein